VRGLTFPDPSCSVLMYTFRRGPRPRPPTSPDPHPAMSTPFLPDDDLLARAAELRAAGATWDAVAAELDADGDRLRRVVAYNRPAWRRLLARARDEVIADGFAEAVHCFRKQLR